MHIWKYAHDVNGDVKHDLNMVETATFAGPASAQRSRTPP